MECVITRGNASRLLAGSHPDRKQGAAHSLCQPSDHPPPQSGLHTGHFSFITALVLGNLL